jgi:predicted enzyme related to lactoylglutathione lyase
MPDQDSPISRIAQIAVQVQDLDRAITFYRDVIGLAFLFRADDLAFFRCGLTRLMLTRPESPEFDHPASVLYYQVEDLETAYNQLKSRGAISINAPRIIAKMSDHDLWMAFFRDSEGNTFALMSEKRSE